jgi:hypothetical protein
MMTEEDEAFNEIERQARQRKESVKAAMRSVEEDDDIQIYQRPWVGLTRDEQSFVYQRLHNATSRIDSFWVDFANAIEAKLKEKNA